MRSGFCSKDQHRNQCTVIQNNTEAWATYVGYTRTVMEYSIAFMGLTNLIIIEGYLGLTLLPEVQRLKSYLLHADVQNRLENKNAMVRIARIAQFFLFLYANVNSQPTKLINQHIFYLCFLL
jgi:hypothetical protein